MNILSFIQSLANELKCQYSLGEVLSSQNRNQYFIPDGIIYYGEKPFVIVEEKSPKNKKQNNKSFHDLARIQDYLGIQWSILLIDDAIYSRPLYGDFKNYGNIIETAQIISSDNADTVLPFSKNEYLEVIKQQISKNRDRISRKEPISLFMEGLQANDIEIEKDGIYFSYLLETE